MFFGHFNNISVCDRKKAGTNTFCMNSIEYILPGVTKSILQTHTVSTTQVDRNRQNRTFYNGVGSWIAGLQTFFLNRTFCNGVGGRTTRLQTHSWHYCSL